MAIYNNIYKGGRKCPTKFYINSIHYRCLDKYDGQGGNTSLLAGMTVGGNCKEFFHIELRSLWRELQRVLSYTYLCEGIAKSSFI